MLGDWSRIPAGFHVLSCGTKMSVTLVRREIVAGAGIEMERKILPRAARAEGDHLF